MLRQSFGRHLATVLGMKERSKGEERGLGPKPLKTPCTPRSQEHGSGRNPPPYYW